MTVRGLSISVVAGLAFLALACQDVIDPPGEIGSVALDVSFVDLEPATASGTGGPVAKARRALPPLEAVQVTLNGPVDTTVTLGQVGSFFEGTITGLPTGNYSVVALGTAGGLVTFYGRNPSVQVTAGVTTTAPITFASFVSDLDPVFPATVEFAKVISFSAVNAANAYVIEVSRDAGFPQPVSLTTTGTSVLVPVQDVGMYYARVRAINGNVAAGESSPSDPVSWSVVPDNATGSSAGDALDLGARQDAVGGWGGFNIFPSTDEDWFSLTLAVGDEVTVAVKTTSLGLPSDLNPTIRLVDAGGATVAMNDDNGGSVESLLAGAIPSSGVYYLVVGSSGQASVGHYELEVTHFAPVVSVTVDPATASVIPGGSVQLSARTFDGAGVELTNRSISWSTEDGNIATVDPVGLVTGVNNGVVGILATSEGVIGRSDITVTASVLTITPDRDTLTSINDSVQLTATGGAAALTWSSSNTNVATVDVNGLVVAVGNGTATITADDGSIQGTAVVVVQQVAAAILTNQPLGALAGQAMNPEPSASVVDARQNVILNQLITFTVIAGGGDLSGGQSVMIPTDQFGVARTPWTLGIPPVQSVEIMAAGLTDTLTVSAYFGGSGTAIADGILGAGEWANSWCIIRDINIPEGGTTPGRMCIMNDATDLYVMVRFDRSPDPNSSVTANFDLDGNGIINNGDVYSFVVQQNGITTLEQDGHWYDSTFDPTCAVGTTCAAADTIHGGTQDGTFMGGNDGVLETAFEFQIPLSTGDVFDINVSAGVFIDMAGILRIWDQATGSTTSTLPGFPSSGFLRVLIFPLP